MQSLYAYYEWGREGGRACACVGLCESEGQAVIPFYLLKSSDISCTWICCLNEDVRFMVYIQYVVQSDKTGSSASTSEHTRHICA